jgi:coenzyme F420-reducing hydrogenase delta subunit
MAGNYHARKRVERAKGILKEVGLEPERLEMFHVSASEGPKFAAVAREMTERAYRLGPNPVKHKVRSAWLANQPAADVAA